MQQSYIREYARNNEAKVLREFEILTDKVIKARTPYIVILNKKSREQ